LIGRRGPCPGAYSGKFTTPENVVTHFPNQGMAQEPAHRFAGESIINFLSNEDTQELAPGFFIMLKDILWNFTAKSNK
jgi:hypothetical protein